MKDDEMECPYCGNLTDDGIAYPEICDEKLARGLEELSIRFEMDREDLINEFNARRKKEFFEKQYGERLKYFKEQTLEWTIPAGLGLGLLFVIFWGAVVHFSYAVPLSAERPTLLVPILFCVLWALSTAVIARYLTNYAIGREERKLSKDFKYDEPLPD